MVGLSFFYPPDKVGSSGLMVGLSSGHPRDILGTSSAVSLTKIAIQFFVILLK